jgi:hypothetical protein
MSSVTSRGFKRGYSRTALSTYSFFVNVVFYDDFVTFFWGGKFFGYFYFIFVSFFCYFVIFIFYLVVFLLFLFSFVFCYFYFIFYFVLY